MDNLTQKLKSDHAAVVGLVAKLDAHLKATELQKVNEVLTVLKGALLAHLSVEDAELYPELIRLAEAAKDESLARTARSFQDNMSRITAGLVAFLGKYEGKSYDIMAFTRDWRSIVEVLGSRITAEESFLYPMFEKAILKSGARK